MANLFGQAIIAACATATGQYNQACNKALDAATRQVGIRQVVDGTENYATGFVITKAKNAAGKDLTSAMGTGMFIYNTAKSKNISFNLPTLGVADSISNQISLKSYNMNLQWHF